MEIEAGTLAQIYKHVCESVCVCVHVCVTEIEKDARLIY